MHIDFHFPTGADWCTLKIGEGPSAGCVGLRRGFLPVRITLTAMVTTSTWLPTFELPMPAGVMVFNISHIIQIDTYLIYTFESIPFI